LLLEKGADIGLSYGGIYFMPSFKHFKVMGTTTHAAEIQAQPAVIFKPAELLEHWLGHRRVTRRMIETFPEDKLFTYSVGGMRPFSELVMEMIGMAGPGIQGIVTGKWPQYSEEAQRPATKAELLKLWDDVTEEIKKFWPMIAPQRFQEVDNAFGQWKGPIWWHLFYFIDNEIHHRGQAYVYLRSLGIEPPAFWDRS
jgi:uncharacterized damage-inducible protein DinB